MINRLFFSKTFGQKEKRIVADGSETNECCLKLFQSFCVEKLQRICVDILLRAFFFFRLQSVRRLYNVLFCLLGS